MWHAFFVNHSQDGYTYIMPGFVLLDIGTSEHDVAHQTKVTSKGI